MEFIKDEITVGVKILAETFLRFVVMVVTSSITAIGVCLLIVNFGLIPAAVVCLVIALGLIIFISARDEIYAIKNYRNEQK